MYTCELKEAIRRKKKTKTKTKTMSLLLKGLSMVIQCVRLLLFLVFINNVQAQRKTFNVKQYGAVADGKTDNSKVYIYLILLTQIKDYD